MESRPLELPPPGDFEFCDRERLVLPLGKHHSRGRLENEPGMAPEVLGLAPWEVSSRRIAASASARMGMLIAIESPRETGALPQILLDQRHSLDFGSTSQTINERIATLGLCLARALVAGGSGCQVRAAGECGFYRPFILRSLADWHQLHRSLKDRHFSKNLIDSGESTAPGSGRWVAIFSDNKDPQTPLKEWLDSSVPPLGLVRVFDPWEESPPRLGNIRLMDGVGNLRGENWSDSRFRAALGQNWRDRDVIWQNMARCLLPKVSHRTDSPWRDALAPWFCGNSRP